MRALRTVGFIFLSLIFMLGVYIAYFQINPEIRVGEYVLTGAHQGRYPMNDSVIERVRQGLPVMGKDLEIGDAALKGNYLNLYKAVTLKYLEEPQD